MSLNGKNGLATMTVGGKEYALTSAPGCKVCGSEYRLEVEDALVRGYNPAQILKHLPQGHTLVERNLRDHLAAGHLPLKSAAVQALAREEAENRGRVVEAGADVLASHVAFARAVVGRVRDRVATGEVEPDVRDALTAARLLWEFEDQETQDDTMVSAMARFMRVVKAVMTDEQFRELGRQVNRDPMLKTLREGRQAQ